MCALLGVESAFKCFLAFLFLSFFNATNVISSLAFYHNRGELYQLSPLELFASLLLLH